jgi:hypothetical protein
MLRRLAPRAIAASAIMAMSTPFMGKDTGRKIQAPERSSAPSHQESRPLRTKSRKAAKAILGFGVAGAAIVAAYRFGPQLLETGSDVASSLFETNEAQSHATPPPASPELSAAAAAAPSPAPETDTRRVPYVSADTIAFTLGLSRLPPSIASNVASSAATAAQETASMVVESDKIPAFTGEINPDTGYLKGTPYDAVAQQLLQHNVNPQDIPEPEYYQKVKAIVEANGMTMASAATDVHANDTLTIDLNHFETYLSAAGENEARSAVPDPGVPPEPSPAPAGADTPPDNSAQEAPSKRELHIPLTAAVVASLGAVGGYALYSYLKNRRHDPLDPSATTADFARYTENDPQDNEESPLPGGSGKPRRRQFFARRKNKQQYVPRHAAWLQPSAT